MGLDNPTIRRLVLAKRLYLHGHEHTIGGTELDRMLAVHDFDNAVELSLKCIPTCFNASIDRNEERIWESLWVAVDRILESNSKPPLPLKQDIMRLHDARNGVQHYGNIPSTHDIERFDIYVEDFFRSILDSVFRLQFDELLMSSLVSNQEIRNILRTSESMLAENDFQGSMKAAFKAFVTSQLIVHEGDRRSPIWHFGIIRETKVDRPHIPISSGHLPRALCLFPSNCPKSPP